MSSFSIQLVATAKSTPLTLESLVAAANRFHASLPPRVAFPTSANTLANLYARLGSSTASGQHHELVDQAKGTRILVPATLVPVLNAFLERKRTSGSSVEQSLYTGMDWHALVQRLIACRPFAFLCPRDTTLTRCGQYYGTATRNWKLVGTEQESEPLTLANYLSYEEMALASLLAVSSPTTFINDGERANCGRPGQAGSFVPFGIFIGAVGTRFEVADEMEARFMASMGSDAAANPPPRWPIRDEWRAFYDPVLRLEGNKNRDIVSRSRCLLDLDMWRFRIRTTIALIVAEAEARAKEYGRAAYVRLVGLGLGVWSIIPDVQAQAYVEETINAIEQSHASHVAVLDLCWIPLGEGDGLRFPTFVKTKAGRSVEVRLTRNAPATPLMGLDKDFLLVATYAWDGNAYPGNEFWLGSAHLAASGDPAAAACCTIAEIQNPLVNGWLLENVVVHE
ncbi:hypothetical protein BCR44DRAFT_55962 [Catenaria anguillulae PL171]|uniref:Uncharacterized protein n=1 Tax=Catenaria anguillulae PL171 TaxID=765915 RepID=A0A1Y2H7V3_9FUNG|nr:hypothetical protein BCR44DRAFT_55962 [Catenaria anguillulae PL171]